MKKNKSDLVKVDNKDKKINSYKNKIKELESFLKKYKEDKIELMKQCESFKEEVYMLNTKIQSGEEPMSRDISFLISHMKEKMKRKEELPLNIFLLIGELSDLEFFKEITNYYNIIKIARKHLKNDKEYFTLSQLLYKVSNKKKVDLKAKEAGLKALNIMEFNGEGKITKSCVLVKFFWKK